MDNYFFEYDQRNNCKLFFKVVRIEGTDQGRGIVLNSTEVIRLLQQLCQKAIYDITDSSQDMARIIFDDGTSILLSSMNIFTIVDGQYDNYLNTLLKNIQTFMEEKATEEYEEYLDDYEVSPRVTRRQPPLKKVVLTAVGLSLAIGLISKGLNLHNGKGLFENTKSEKLDPVIEETFVTNIETDILAAVKDYIISESVELSFESRLNSGKLDQVKNDCSKYLDPLIERYGLPKDFTYALVSQESGKLSMDTTGYACGPMQIQPASMHGEAFSVPVYDENGQFTGEYDEFYAADENRLDDPVLNGKKVLIIQDLEDNFQIGCAYFRKCIDRYKNIFIAADAYNKGLYAFDQAISPEKRDYYIEHPEDLSWMDTMINYFGTEYGDPDYLWHVLSYLDTDFRGQAEIEYSYKDGFIKYEITNTRDLTTINDNNVVRG